MTEINFYKLGTVDDNLLTRVVIVCRYKGNWIYCKHKDRKTWEIPGGCIESGESWQEATKRELFEETGAVEFDVEPIALYFISNYALLCFAEIKKLEKLPTSEIGEIHFFDVEPENLTYPHHSKMLELVKQYKKL